MDKHKILKILYPTAGRIFLKYIKRIRVTDVNLFPEKTEVIYPECGKFYYYFPNLRLGSIQFLPSGNSYTFLSHVNVVRVLFSRCYEQVKNM